MIIHNLIFVSQLFYTPWPEDDKLMIVHFSPNNVINLLHKISDRSRTDDRSYFAKN